MACCGSRTDNVQDRTISLAEAKQAALSEELATEAEPAQTMQPVSEAAPQTSAALPWDVEAPGVPDSLPAMQPDTFQPAASFQPERRRSGILTAISMLPEAATELGLGQASAVQASEAAGPATPAEGPSAEGSATAGGIEGGAEHPSAKSDEAGGNEGSAEDLGGERDEAGQSKEVLKTEAEGSTVSVTAWAGESLVRHENAGEGAAEDALAAEVADNGGQNRNEVPAEPNSTAEGEGGELDSEEPVALPILPELPQSSAVPEQRSLAGQPSLPGDAELRPHSAGGRPQSAKGKSASKTAHELYLQTLQEARSALTQRPRSAPRQAARPQSAMSEPMQAISERLQDAQASALQRKPAVPLPSPEERLKEEVRRQLLVPVKRWGVAEVGRWVAVIGLPQYRKRFIHQGISGPLLLKLGHAQLKGDLEVGVLGHREALLSAVRGLPATYDQAVAEEPWHHQPAADSPESPVLRAKLHRQKLLRELEKAQAHSAALHSKLEGTAHQAELVEGDVLHIRGAILDLERHFQLAASLAPEQGVGQGVDKQGIVPWHPNGAPFELTIPKIERASAERQSLSPKRAVSPSMHTSGQAPSFLDRMGMDLQERKHRLKAMKQTVYSPERVFQDPNYTSKLRKADLATISSHLQTALGVKLSALTSGRTPLASLSSPLQHAKSGVSVTAEKADQDPASPNTAASPPPATLDLDDASRATADDHDAQPIMGLQPPSQDLDAMRADGQATDLSSNKAEGPKEEQRGNGPEAIVTEGSGQVEDSGGNGEVDSIQDKGRDEASISGAGAPQDTSHSRSSRDSLPPGTRVSFSLPATGNGETTRPVEPQSVVAVLDYLAGQVPQRIGLNTNQAKSVLTAKGEGRKVQQLASIFREVKFMERYENEAQAREQRRQQLAEHWHKIETQPPKPPKGRQLRYWKAPVTQQQRDENELQLCHLLFYRAGWPLADFTSNNGSGADEKLTAVLTRAEAVATGAAFKKSQGIRQALTDFEDGLEEVQASFLERMAEQGEDAGEGQEGEEASAAMESTMSRTGGSSASRSAIQKTASSSSSAYFAEGRGCQQGNCTPQTGPVPATDETLYQDMVAGVEFPGGRAKPRTTGEVSTSRLGATGRRKGGQDEAVSKAARTQQALSKTLPKGASSEDVLGGVVQQLARCRLDELARLKSWTGLKKQLAVYRALVTQRFLQDIEEDKKKRAKKTQALLKATEVPSKKLTKEQADAFFARLQTDGERRRRGREEAIKAAEDQQLATMEAARKRLAEALSQGRPKSAARPGSAAVRPASAAPSAARRPASARP